MSSGPPLRWGLIGASDIAARWVLPAMRGCGDSVEFVYSSAAAWASEYAAPIAGAGRPTVDGAEGLSALAGALAVAESAKTGRTVTVADVG